MIEICSSCGKELFPEPELREWEGIRLTMAPRGVRCITLEVGGRGAVASEWCDADLLASLEAIRAFFISGAADAK